MEAFAEQRFGTVLDQLAAKTPAPGGGAAASIAGATAAALAGMVVSYSLEKKSLAEHQTMLKAAAGRLGEMRATFLELAERDAAAYTELNELQKLPEDDPHRLEQEPGAITRAVEIPQRAVDLSIELLDLIESLVGRSNTNLRSDLAGSAALAEASAAAAGWNVRINTPLLPERERAPLQGRLATTLDAARQTRDRVERACL